MSLGRLRKGEKLLTASVPFVYLLHTAPSDPKFTLQDYAPCIRSRIEETRRAP